MIAALALWMTTTIFVAIFAWVRGRSSGHASGEIVGRKLGYCDGYAEGAAMAQAIASKNFQENNEKWLKLYQDLASAKVRVAMMPAPPDGAKPS